MKNILEVREISKRFKIKHNEPYLSLRDSISNIFTKKENGNEDFWALKNVSFDVKPGDSIGIIGRNGAGKSTLLKILSKITPPSSGKIISRGRIASLLEVGTGFHSELTGRENIFLNGSILGLKKTEITKQFDAIVDFSGVEKFLDTPLKHYSSGMQLRLAFAVAAHLEPEILIIDEVLAVGDSEFQKKCMGKMGEVSNSGRTILFVSHNMGVVAKLCKSAIVMQKGSIAFNGNTSDAIDFYLEEAMNITGSYVNPNNSPEKELYFNEIKVIDEASKEKYEFSFYEQIAVKFNITINKYIPDSKIGIALLDKYKNRIFSEYCLINSFYDKPGQYSVSLLLPKELIAPNHYSFLAALLQEGNIFQLEEDICPITILDTGTERANYDGYDYGCIIPKCVWETNKPL